MTDIKFEDALARLEQIVDTLEAGNLPLEDSLKAFEEGVGLARRCSKYLEEAEKRIELLTKDEGGLLRAEPFAWDGTSRGELRLRGLHEGPRARGGRWRSSVPYRRRARRPRPCMRAMRYSIFAGGKRLRPVLVIAGAEAWAAVWSGAAGGLRAGDDPHLLADSRRPARDGHDDYRRGRPTSHKVFGEAWPISWPATGCSPSLPPPRRLLATGPGRRRAPRRVVDVRRRGQLRDGGRQVADLEAEGRRSAPIPSTTSISTRTAALIRASTPWGRDCPAPAATRSARSRWRAGRWGWPSDRDDMLDVTATTARAR